MSGRKKSNPSPVPSASPHLQEQEWEEEKRYCFCGNGEGVPGMPHEVTMEQAEALGLGEALDACIKNGSYVATKATD
jgi:hypothetical protein